VPPFSGHLGREAFYRTGADEMLKSAASRSATLGDSQISLLWEKVSQMQLELSHPKPRIYYDGDDPVMMSLIEMRHLGSVREATYDSVNMCVAVFSAGAERHRSNVELKESVVDRLINRKDELEKTIGKIEKDISGNRENRYKSMGDVIMRHIHDIEKGTSAFTDPDTGIEISLDPRITAVQNAQAYYEKAKKARESYRQAVARLAELKKELAGAVNELESIESGADSGRVASLAKSEKKKEEASTPFREFEINGYKIYVGKDAKNNDALTFGFAKPNDVFLHARGVSGSHVIVRNASRDYPQKVVLEYAARIAAHYSKARSSGLVPVSYTMRKFVKKAKGKPGAVFVDREEVIFVKPGIPQPPR
jgi:predicted ribosome quality control (RQC) complex YloA/Tae2 family protein